MLSIIKNSGFILNCQRKNVAYLTRHITAGCPAYRKREILQDVPHQSSLYRNRANDAKAAKENPPESADVVVIGGGSVGCSTAYHLAKMEIGSIVLVEKESLTAGTTWHTAGILWNLRMGRCLTVMQTQTADIISRILPEETGFDAGWLKTGAMFITRCRDQLDALEKLSKIGSEYGVESHLIDVAEISRLHPLMNTDGLVGGLYSPHDGSLDPATLCTSYSKAAKKYGAQIFEHCEVKDIKVNADFLGRKHVVAVETDLGRIKTNNVVNCTGAWAPYIAEMVGLKVPQVVYKHSYVVTQGMPGIENTPHIRDIDNAIYNKRQGSSLLFGGYEREPILVEKVDKDFAFGLYDFDWDHFEVHMKSAINLVPDVAKVGIRSTVCGPETFSSDGNPIMGESPRIKGFFYGSAFNSGGMMMGGGAGRQLAHWVANGAPETDMSICDICRFPHEVADHRPWVIESCHEHFITRYNRQHANNQPLACRNLLKTPLHEIHLENGAFFSLIHGWEVPAYYLPGSQLPLLDYDYYGCYGNKMHTEYAYREHLAKDCSFEIQKEIQDQVVKEALACCESVAIVDLSHLSTFVLSGPEAEDCVRQLLPTDVTELSENGCLDSLMLSEDGTILTNVVVNRNGNDGHIITGPAEMRNSIERHVNRFLQSTKFNCLFVDETVEYNQLRVQGPESRQLLESVGAKISVDAEGVEGGELRINEQLVVLKRISQRGVQGYDLHCRGSVVADVFKTLLGSELKPTLAGIRALKCLALESGHPDLFTTTLAGAQPAEVNLMDMCPLNPDEGMNYVGKNALLRKDAKTSKSLVYFSTTPEVPVFDGDLIWKDGIYVGTVKEAAYAPNMDKFVMCGYINSPDGKTDEFIKSGGFEVGKSYERVVATVKE